MGCHEFCFNGGNKLRICFNNFTICNATPPLTSETNLCCLLTNLLTVLFYGMNQACPDHPAGGRAACHCRGCIGLCPNDISHVSAVEPWCHAAGLQLAHRLGNEGLRAPVLGHVPRGRCRVDNITQAGKPRCNLPELTRSRRASRNHGTLGHRECGPNIENGAHWHAAVMLSTHQFMVRQAPLLPSICPPFPNHRRTPFPASTCVIYMLCVLCVNRPITGHLQELGNCGQLHHRRQDTAGACLLAGVARCAP